MRSANEVRVSTCEDGITLNVLGAAIRVKSSGASDQLFYADHPVPVGYQVPLHVHLDEDELFYILEGELTLLSREGESTAGPGTFIHLPHGVPHGFANRSGAPVRMLVIATPGGALHGVFRDLDRAAQADALTPALVGQVLVSNRLALVA